MELAEFLLVRIEEDEAWVRDFGQTLSGYDPGMPDDGHRQAAECEAKRRLITDGPNVCVNIRDAEDPREHYPHRVLAPGLAHECEDCIWAEAQDAQWEFAVQCLALPYAGHPDYDPAWKPS